MPYFLTRLYNCINNYINTIISQLTAVIVDCWTLPVSVIRTRSMYTIFVVIATIVIAAGLDCVVFYVPANTV